eukprot:4901448-Pyramimonas_sp.AAC.1
MARPRAAAKVSCMKPALAAMALPAARCRRPWRQQPPPAPAPGLVLQPAAGATAPTGSAHPFR